MFHFFLEYFKPNDYTTASVTPIFILMVPELYHVPYSKARLLEVADRVCDFEKPKLAVGKMICYIKITTVPQSTADDSDCALY